MNFQLSLIAADWPPVSSVAGWTKTLLVTGALDCANTGEASIEAAHAAIMLKPFMHGNIRRRSGSCTSFTVGAPRKLLSSWADALGGLIEWTH